jgi:hypothetical protein
MQNPSKNPYVQKVWNDENLNAWEFRTNMEPNH